MRSFRAIAMAGAGLILTASAVFSSGAVANANPVSAVAVKAFNSSLMTPVVVSRSDVQLRRLRYLILRCRLLCSEPVSIPTAVLLLS